MHLSPWFRGVARALGAAICLVLLPAPPSVAQSIVPPAGRDVTPPGFTPGPKVDGPLVREPAPPRPPPEPRWRRYFLPVTTDAATFQVENQTTIRIAGVEPPPVDAVCPLSDGTNWPCGRTALHSLRMFLHGRAIECYFPYADSLTDVTAPCRVGQTDLGLWLLAQGWARPGDLATDAYRKATEEARCARLGVWRGQQPDGSCPAATN